jgi:2-desacetyl-2-hydroxyethyl bacteriochlorophyllide A dehydrogenase
MKAVRMIAVGQPLQMQELPVPVIEEKDILVRVHAAGVCHSDVHYRAGLSPVRPLPLTLGHEVAGVVEQAGTQVTHVKVGDRVGLHYNITCGECYYCTSGKEQFCSKVRMLGHFTNGGYAEYLAVPARNAVRLPDEIPFEQGATLMCASATAFHTLHKSRLTAGETVAVFGVGGLGMSAIQLARAFGALDVFAIDINQDKLKLAAQYGAIPVNAEQGDPVAKIWSLTQGKGVDVALELIGLPQTMKQAVLCLGVMGRAVIAGISAKPLEIDTYRDLIGKELEIIGSNDHLFQELPLVVELARRKVLDTARLVTRTVPLEAGPINQALDELEKFGGEVRTVIVP